MSHARAAFGSGAAHLEATDSYEAFVPLEDSYI